jgi:hypothetical protein
VGGFAPVKGAYRQIVRHAPTKYDGGHFSRIVVAIASVWCVRRPALSPHRTGSDSTPGLHDAHDHSRRSRYAQGTRR